MKYFYVDKLCRIDSTCGSRFVKIKEISKHKMLHNCGLRFDVLEEMHKKMAGPLGRGLRQKSGPGYVPKTSI